VGLNEPAPKAVRLAARRTLEAFGLAALEGRTLKELSYGQMRRILFARAFVARPGLLLLDEPFAGVDRSTRLELRKIVERAVAEGVGVMLATHHRDEWPAGATHELELREGRVIYCGEIRERPERARPKKTGRQS
jgi:molybdate transport system ATP-binding protein